MTEWLPIPSTGGKYLASDTGLIRHRENNRPLTTVFSPGHRCRSVTLTFDDSRQGTRSVMRLVWEAFVGPVPKGWVVSPVNGNLSDTRPDNLHLKPAGVYGFLSSDDVRSIFERAANGESHAEIAQSLNMAETTICGILNRRAYRHVDIPPDLDYGVRNPRKLDQTDADYIRKLVQSGEKQVSLARYYGVSISMISRIIHGTRW